MDQEVFRIVAIEVSARLDIEAAVDERSMTLNSFNFNVFFNCIHRTAKHQLETQFIRRQKVRKIIYEFKERRTAESDQ